jgi:hypothetical protein
MIRTETRYYNQNLIETFTLPPFSEVKKIYIVDNNIHIIYEFPDEMCHIEQTKTIMIKIQEFRSMISEPGYQYFDTQIKSRPELSNSSFSPNNIQLNIVNSDIIYHFFIQEIKPLIEQRDNKIDNIIKND